MKIDPSPQRTGRPHRDIAPGTVVVPLSRSDVTLLTAKATDGSRLLVNLNTGFLLDAPAADSLDVMGFVPYPEARVVFRSE